jgi:hypothetical protein
MFTLLVLQHFYFVSDRVSMRDAASVLLLVVLDNGALGAVLHELPVGLETDVVNRVSSKNHWRWRSAQGGVYWGSHRESQCS